MSTAVAPGATATVGPLPVVPIDDFAEWGLVAYTTTRMAGTFGSQADEPMATVLARWNAVLGDAAARGVHAFATAHQVHGAGIHQHGGGWRGWLRGPDGDGHLWTRRGHGAAVTVADCVPVFLAHPSGAAAVLHSGWKGTAAGITERAIALFRGAGLSPADCRLHLGPAISGGCYEVSPAVLEALGQGPAGGPAPVDLRALIADRARALGLRQITTSPWCTRSHAADFFSHRGGDAGRQIGVLLSPPT